MINGKSFNRVFAESLFNLASQKKSKVEESFTTKTPKEKVIKSNITETQTTENKTASIKNTINKWTWVYIIINGFLVLLGNQSEEVTGVLIFSVLIINEESLT